MTTVSLIADGDDLILPLPEQACEQLGWKIGDTVSWTDHGDGTYSLTKKAPVVNTVKVLVETVQIIKHSYFVDVPADHPQWATDTVTCNEAKSALSEYLDEVITGYRVVSPAEYKKIIGDCDE
jgi:hypothetical protein